MLKKMNLRTKIFLAIIPTLIITVIAISVVNIISFRAVQTGYKHLLEDKAQSVAENIRTVVNKSLLSFSINQMSWMNAYLSGVVQNSPDISYCFIADKTRILFHSDEKNNLSKLPAQIVTALSAPNNDSKWSLSVGKYYEFIFPIILADERVGTIHIGVETAIIVSQINRMILATVLVLAISVIASMTLIFFLLQRHIIGPMTYLSQKASDISAKHDLNQRIEIKSDDEFGVFSSAFNTMLGSLQSYYNDLQIKNESLRTINTITDEIYHSLNSQDVLDKAAIALAQYTHAPLVAIYSRDDHLNILDRIGVFGHFTAEVDTAVKLPLKGSLSGIALETGEIVTCHIPTDINIDPETKRQLMQEGFITGILIPLLVQGKNLGVLNLFFHEERLLSSHERETLLSIAQAIGPVMANARHVSQIEAEIAERKRAEEKYRGIFNNTTEGIFQSTLEGQILTANPALARILGYDSPADLMQSIKNIETDLLVQQGRRQEFLDSINKDGYVRDFEYQAYRKDRRIIDATINVYTVRDENQNFLYFEGVFKDITELKRYQERLEEQVRERTNELASANKKMEDEIAERKEAEEKIAIIARELERSNKELDDFAYVASHDLKEPLRGIHNYASFLLEDYADKIDNAATEKLKTLVYLAKRLEGFINDLLKFSRVGRVALTMSETEIDEVVKDTLTILKPTLEKEHIDVRIPRPLPKVKCDNLQVVEILQNLISNAIKYNDKPDKWIEIGYTDDKNTVANNYIFYVRDNGIGIDKKFFDSIFTIFKRLHGRDKFGGGTGAGLTIVKKIIERHKGKIWLESTPAEGTTFYFTLQGEKNVQ